jgi:hypothetical protein
MRAEWLECWIGTCDTLRFTRSAGRHPSVHVHLTHASPVAVAAEDSLKARDKKMTHLSS